MQNLIEDILELTAIEGGTVGVHAEATELMPIANDVITSLVLKLHRVQSRCATKVQPGTIVFADPRRLEQMLTNLLRAIKFNRESVKS